MSKSISKTRSAIAGLISGAANGLFGSGGGLLAVPALEKGGLETKKAHATSLAITLPLSIVSACVYFNNNNLDLPTALKYLPGGVIGIWIGAALLKHISSMTLNRLFGAVMIYFGVRMIMS
ncbi:MAG: sulfite exporter TauE/SafE family protein [Ruminococcus sp.]|nr:sulfite exporter TauE/SafE family protein [Ruminococcus sp.]